jgi:hypothetical protein
MGKAILNCMIENEARECGNNRVCLARASLKGFFGQIYLWIWWSSLASWLRRVLGVGYA